MMNTTTRWLLVLLVTLFSAGIATDNLAFAQSGDSNVPFRYEITRYWQHDTSMGSWPPIDLNDHGDAVVTPWYDDSDFSAGLPLLYLSHEERAAIYPLAEPDSDGNIDINEMVAVQFAAGLLDVDAALLNDNGDVRSLVTAEAINDAGQFAGEYPIDELADDGFPRWLAYRYTPPSPTNRGLVLATCLTNLF
jgi:hypothetical protein